MNLVPQADKTASSPALSTLMPELAQWFSGRPLWLQDAARRLLENGEIQQKDITELLILCKLEAGVPVDSGTPLTAKPPRVDAFTSADAAYSLRLESISKVQGINALAPRSPLQFGTEPLVIVYGSNGSGKSGYMRILKHICGALAPGHLLPNVFSSTNPAQGCRIGYSKAGVSTECEWAPANGVNGDLRAVSVYDTACAHVHVNEENQLSFEPGILKVIRRLVEISDELGRRIDSEIGNLIPRLPKLPAGYEPTQFGGWYARISPSTKDEEISGCCKWTEADEKHLTELNQRLAESKPTEAAAALRKQRQYLETFSVRLDAIAQQLSDDNFVSLQDLRADATAKRLVVDVDAKAVFDDAPVNGVGSTSWKLLWEQARVFSETEAYTAYEFPNVAEDAFCVLCQQPLSSHAGSRLTNFEAFVRGALEREARDSEERLAQFVDTLEEVPVPEDVEEQLDLGGISDAEVRQTVVARCDWLRKRRDSFISVMDLSKLPTLSVEGSARDLAPIIQMYGEQAELYDADAASGKKEDLQKSVTELAARQWIAAQKQAIITEVMRQRMEALLQSARRLVNTQALSTKTSQLAETLVTSAYKERFANEMKVLGGSRIHVAVDKTRTAKGKAWHKVQLVGRTRDGETDSILSEGEFRVVSLAAFLADVEGKAADTPVIFDDPVTSLDQDFEEAACARIAQLCTTRQVVVFTHRVSFLTLLEGAARAGGVDCRLVSLQREPWGAGEPSGPPYLIGKTRNTLNALRDHKVPQARKMFEEQGTAAYRDVAKGICSDIRILVERIVELDVLAGVIERFRREVNTKGKLGKLAIITPDDCAYIDELMTKYSRYEHSQPGEVPIALPDPDEFDADLTRLREWMDEFTARQKAA
jgi:energy-coupling factor transporter ATP-binding protein EcfA2